MLGLSFYRNTKLWLPYVFPLKPTKKATLQKRHTLLTHSNSLNMQDDGCLHCQGLHRNFACTHVSSGMSFLGVPLWGLLWAMRCFSLTRLSALRMRMLCSTHDCSLSTSSCAYVYIYIYICIFRTYSFVATHRKWRRPCFRALSFWYQPKQFDCIKIWSMWVPGITSRCFRGFQRRSRLANQEVTLPRLLRNGGCQKTWVARIFF